ncbi:hypothetical protein AGMMS49938_18320 [Fibrobacterales bacterium]|nr:hypothetical protein AGMMS49938_18320 [Fibrobacterales bacterium]
MSKLLKILAVAVAVLVVALIAAFFVVKSKFPPEKIQALVSEEASKALNRQVSVGGASLKIFPLGLQVTGITVANNSGVGFSKEPLLNLPVVTVKIDILKLLKLQVAIDKISLEDLSLLYEIMPDGRTSIDGLGGEPDTTAKDTSKLDLTKLELPASLALNSFEIKNAKITYSDRANKQKVVLGDIYLKTNLSLDQTLENIKTSSSLVLEQVSLQDESLGIRKGNIKIFLDADVAANLKLQHIEIQKFNAGLQSVSVSASGTVDRFLEKIMVADLTVESNQINLAELLKEVPQDINPEIAKVSASGTASFKVAVKGAIQPEKLPPLNGNITLANIAVSHSDLPAGVSALTGNINFTENSASIKSFSFLLAGQPTSLQLEASNLLSAQPLLNDFSLNAKLNLGTLFALANKIISIPQLSDLAGNISANLSAKGILDPSHPERLSVAGGAELQNIVAKTPLIPDAVNVNGVVKFSNTEISLAPAVKIGNSDVDLNISVQDYLALVMPRLALGKKTTANIKVSSANLELDKLLPPSDPNKTEEEEIPMEQYPELPDIIANVDVNLANTVFRHLTLSDFNLAVKFADSKANIAGKGRLYTGSFNTAVFADLSNRKSANVKFALDVDKVEANDFISHGNDNVSGNSAMAKQIRNLDNTVFGKLTMKVDVTTKGLPHTFVDNLSGPISVSVTNGSLQGSKLIGEAVGGISGFEIAGKKVLSGLIPVSGKGDVKFEDLKAVLEAKDGQLLVKNFDIKAGALGVLAFTGGIGFTGDLNLNLQNTLSSSISRNLNALTKASPVSLYQKDAGGNALLFFNIGGTFADPKVSLVSNPVANLTDALKGAASAKLSEVKDKAKEKLNAEKAKLAAEADAKKKELEAKAQAEANRIKAEADKKKAEVTDKAKSGVKDALKGLKR